MESPTANPLLASARGGSAPYDPWKATFAAAVRVHEYHAQRARHRSERNGASVASEVRSRLETLSARRAADD